jgi:acetyl-CoA/propionyl-CoA carboxylase biotin carboxyl carrier protein
VFSKVLVANRGEVAIRIGSTLSKMGIESVGVHTYGDRRSKQVEMLNESVLLSDSDRSGYLDSHQIINAALKTRAQAIHPGYGFLAENAEFAKRCEEAGLVFIGPTAAAIQAMGGKISARDYAARAGVPIVPGISEPDLSDEQLLKASVDYAFPLLIKPAAGGGGKGLHIANDVKELAHFLPIARREALASFGDGTLYLEKYLKRSRHIEFQIVGDNFGHYLHLWERECSLQRRHQKVIEEAPSVLLTADQRERMGDAAIKLAAAIDYQNLGTVEFLVDSDNPENFYFMEMNTRLQVEHRVTEMITGLDLVECQLKLAAGEELKKVIPSVVINGHAIEARIYAEDAYNEFLPTSGQIGIFSSVNSKYIITDAAIRNGEVVSSAFDPMLAKVSAWGKNRTKAITNLEAVLGETVLLGITTNIDYLIQLLERSEFRNSQYDTNFLESVSLIKEEPPTEVLNAFAFVASKFSEAGSENQGWRLRGASPATFSGYLDNQRFTVTLPVLPIAQVIGFYANQEWWIHLAGFGTWQLKEVGLRRRTSERVSDEVLSPMPGTVVTLEVKVGDQVEIGDALLTVEAMKMEHVVRAKQSGKISHCHVSVGSNVHVGEILMEVSEVV